MENKMEDKIEITNITPEDKNIYPYIKDCKITDTWNNSYKQKYHLIHWEEEGYTLLKVKDEIYSLDIDITIYGTDSIHPTTFEKLYDEIARIKCLCNEGKCKWCPSRFDISITLTPIYSIVDERQEEINNMLNEVIEKEKGLKRLLEKIGEIDK